MNLVENSLVLDAMSALRESWAAGSGRQYAEVFTIDSRYVAFDGTVLNGRHEIDAFHQRAFDSHLRHTELELELQHLQAVGPGRWLLCSRGGIVHRKSDARRLTGASVQIFVGREDSGKLLIEAFQNTRVHPITDRRTAEAWAAFDALWND